MGQAQHVWLFTDGQKLSADTPFKQNIPLRVEAELAELFDPRLSFVDRLTSGLCTGHIATRFRIEEKDGRGSNSLVVKAVEYRQMSFALLTFASMQVDAALKWQKKNPVYGVSKQVYNAINARDRDSVFRQPHDLLAKLAMDAAHVPIPANPKTANQLYWGMYEQCGEALRNINTIAVCYVSPHLNQVERACAIAGYVQQMAGNLAAALEYKRQYDLMTKEGVTVCDGMPEDFDPVGKARQAIEREKAIQNDKLNRLLSQYAPAEDWYEV